MEDAVMGRQLADVMIHIDETLSEESLKQIEAVVRDDICVVSAGVPAGNPHMMLVAYNPDCVSATDILAKVKSAGVHAELVGM
jgi:hypothetical protein